MPEFIYHLPDVYVFGLFSVISIVISILAIFVVTRHFPIESRYRDNAAVGNASAIIGIIYGVLSGLIALYLMNGISTAVTVVQNEASAVADIYRDSKWLKEPSRSVIRDEVKKYLHQVINVEWDQMRSGAMVSDDGKDILSKIDKEIFLYPEKNSLDYLILHHILEEMKALFEAREERINISYQQLSSETWIVILIGTILLIGISFIFGMNFYLHLLTVVSIAIMTSSILFLLITLDKPFQGEFAVDSGPFVSVLDYLGKYEKQMDN